jgi:tetratricopeptide (TPR) repeat protein
MNLESSSITPFIFTAFRKLVLAKPGLKLGPYTEISLKIFKELGQQDLSNARSVCKEWKQLIEQTEEWKKLYSKIAERKALEENQNTGDKSSLSSSFSNQWGNHQIAKSLWHNPTAIIDGSIVAKVNAAADYLGKEGFKLKGVPSDGDCFFSAFIGSYNCLSRKIPLLDESTDKVFYLRQVLSDIIKYKNNERAEKIKGRRTWISGLGEGDLLATALSIPIRLITVNEEQLACGIHDRLIFSKASSSPKDNSQEWKEISEEKKLEEYILIVDLGGHFIYAQKPLKLDNFLFLKQATSPTSRFSESRYLYPHDKASKVAKTCGNKRFLTIRQNLNKRDKNDIFDPSNPLTTLPLEIFQQIFHSFSKLTEDELRKVLDARSCARVFKQLMPDNIKLLQLYQPKKLQSYLDKLAKYLDKNLFSISEDNTFLSIDRLEEDYTQVLKVAVQKEDPIQTRLCIEKLGDIYLIKRTQQTLLQAAGLYNYALHNAALDEQESIKEKLSKVEILLNKACKGKTLESSLLEEQFENNRKELKKFRDEIEEKIQAFGLDPSPEKVQEIYHEIALWIKTFFKSLVDQAQEVLEAAPCKYAMIGFGSLAREEMTPYSDLEFGILMQEDTFGNRDYFRRLTTLLHLRVINLGETILPALDIPCIKEANFFDSVTPRGFAFDGEGVQGKGCKTPFGNRQTFELIQTPEKMAQYIAKDEEGLWWHEKERHLPMELLTFTQLIGNDQLAKQYRQNIQEKLSEPYQEDLTLCQYLAKHHLVQEDMIAFNPGMRDLSRLGMLFKVKNDFYRFPHLALDRLALLKEIKASDTFTRIDQLNKQKTIRDSAAEKLKEWMSIVLFMRLKTYSHYEAQKEMMNPLLQPFGFDGPELIKQHFVLDEKALDKIKKIHSIFIPFYQAIQAFLAGDEGKLTSSILDDNSPQTQGDIALRLFHIEDAKKCYELARKAEPANSLLFNAIGTIYRAQNNLNEAAEYFNKALTIDLNSLGENNLVVARDYINLGIIYFEKGDLQLALKYLHKALSLNSKFFGKKHENLAIVYHNLGTIYQSKGDLKKAANYGEKALANGIKLLGENHPLTTMHYNNLGQVYQDQGNLGKALEYANKALIIDLNLFGENHPIIARDYNNLGKIYYEKGELKKAANYGEKALAINLGFYGENHSSVEINYNNLGLIYQEQGNREKAAEYINKALKINRKLLGKNHPTIARNYSNLAAIYEEQGSLEKAAEYINNALEISLKHFVEDHPTIACLFGNLANIRRKQANLVEALEYVNKALKINCTLFGENHSRVAINYNELAIIYTERDDLVEADEYTNRALAIDLKLFGENHPRVARDYNNLGLIYQKQGKLEEAVEYINKALAIDLKLYGEDHPNVAISYNNLGQIYQGQGNLKKAEEYILRAINTIKKLGLDETHPHMIKYYSNLRMVYQTKEKIIQKFFCKIRDLFFLT